MTLLGERVMVLPDESDERKTPSGLIIPQNVKIHNNQYRAGVIWKKGTGTPWNSMDDVHVKERIGFKRGAGIPYEEETEDGRTVKMLILRYSDILFNPLDE